MRRATGRLVGDAASADSRLSCRPCQRAAYRGLFTGQWRCQPKSPRLTIFWPVVTATGPTLEDCASATAAAPLSARAEMVTARRRRVVCMVASGAAGAVTRASLLSHESRLHALVRARMRTCSHSRAAAETRGVEHGDVAAPRLDDPSLAQRVQRLADRLARGARPGGELLLRQRELDVDVVIVGGAEALGELHEPLGDPADDVVGRE